MYMKYVRLLFLICASAMYVGCSEDPFDWSGDSERSVPIPVDLSLEVVEDIGSASCGIEYHEDDLPILEVGFFYGDNEGVTYNTGTKIKCTVSGNVFTTEGISNFLSDNMRSQLYTLMYQSQNVKVLITITCLRYKVTKSFVYLLATNI